MHTYVLDTRIENLNYENRFFHYDIDDDCNSWKAAYAIMRVPLPEA